MRFSKTSLDEAITYLLPNRVHKAIEQGVEFNKPDLINIVIEDYFMVTLSATKKLPRIKHEAYIVIKEAMLDLKNEGYLTYGGVTIYFKKEI